VSFALRVSLASSAVAFDVWLSFARRYCWRLEPPFWGHHLLDRSRRLAQDLDLVLQLGDTERCCNLPHAPSGLDQIKSLATERGRIRLGHNPEASFEVTKRSVSQHLSPENQGNIKVSG